MLLAWRYFPTISIVILLFIKENVYGEKKMITIVHTADKSPRDHLWRVCRGRTSVITCNQVQSRACKVTIIASDISKFGSDVTVQCSPLNARPIEFHACSASLIARSRRLSAIEFLVKRHHAEKERDTLMSIIMHGYSIDNSDR